MLCKTVILHGQTCSTTLRANIYECIAALFALGPSPSKPFLLHDFKRVIESVQEQRRALPWILSCCIRIGRACVAVDSLILTACRRRGCRIDPVVMDNRLAMSHGLTDCQLQCSMSEIAHRLT